MMELLGVWFKLQKQNLELKSVINYAMNSTVLTLDSD